VIGAFLRDVWTILWGAPRPPVRTKATTVAVGRYMYLSDMLDAGTLVPGDREVVESELRDMWDSLSDAESLEVFQYEQWRGNAR